MIINHNVCSWHPPTLVLINKNLNQKTPKLIARGLDCKIIFFILNNSTPRLLYCRYKARLLYNHRHSLK